MNFLYKYIMLLSLVLTIVACEDSLNLVPESDLSDGTFWKTSGDFKQAANDFYWDLPRSSGLTDLISESDFMTDDQINDVSSGVNVAPTSDNRWRDAYIEIRKYNNLLEKADAYEGEEDLSQYVAEAHFFRAYTSFNLVKWYGRYVIIGSVLDVTGEELNVDRNSRDEGIDAIIEDLENAIVGLPLESAITSVDKGRASVQAAHALLARVALFEGTWQKYRDNIGRANELLTLAFEHSQAVMNYAEHELFKNEAALGDESYRYLFVLTGPDSNPGGLTKNDQNEYVFSTKYDIAVRTQGGNISHGMNSFHSSPTKKLADMYLCEDGLPISMSPLYKDGDLANPLKTAELLNRDLRMTNSFRIPGEFYCQRINCETYEPVIGTQTLTGFNWVKFVSIEQIESGQESFDTPLIRYAEVLLIYAEALFELNGSISDDDLNLSINLLRDRVNMPFLTNEFVSTNGLDMQTEIRRERAVELAAEGQRLLDLKRWKTAEVEMPMDLMGVLVTGTDWDESGAIYPSLKDGFVVQQDASTRNWEEKHYLDPIPLDQINLNPNLSQNPGW